jgi:hypothetical protein
MYVDMRMFAYDHLPEELQEISKPFGKIAQDMLAKFEDRKGFNSANAEMEVGLRKLLEAKDCFVRASLLERMDKEDDGNN